METKTETGINIATYAAERDSGLARLTKPLPGSGNYLYVRASWALGPAGADGRPVMVEGAPQISNINRGSLDDLELKLDEEEIRIREARVQIAALRADMDALDNPVVTP